MMERCRLICTRCSKSATLDVLKGRCDCGGTLLVEYDLENIRTVLTKSMLASRPNSMWRYRELLPVRNMSAIVSMGEGGTSMVRLPLWEKRLSLRELWVKREEQNPTGSFKARGFSASLSLIRERSIAKVAVNSNGNAASALAAYAAYAGVEAYVFIPKDCPPNIVRECIYYGAKTFLVDGLIHDAALIIEEGKQEQGWFLVGTLKEPGRVEGKKTMGLELAEQLNWKLPDAIIYPTGGGSGIIGMWKAFKELRQLGWVQGEMPRLISVQEQGCHPLVDAVTDSSPQALTNAAVSAQPTGMRVPFPPDQKLLTDILTETGGTAVAVTTEEITEAERHMGAHGISSSPEGAATLAALLKMRETGLVKAGEKVVLFNTSHAMKYWSSSGLPDVPVIQSYRDFSRFCPI